MTVFTKIQKKEFLELNTLSNIKYHDDVVTNDGTQRKT